jgi:hypothetical protein
MSEECTRQSNSAIPESEFVHWWVGIRQPHSQAELCCHNIPSIGHVHCLACIRVPHNAATLLVCSHDQQYLQSSDVCAYLLGVQPLHSLKHMPLCC